MLTGALDSALGAHRAAVEDFLRGAGRLPAPAWAVPRAPRKWTPAQIVEHVALAEEFAVRMVRGEVQRAGMPFWIRPLLRWLGVDLVLRVGAFPKGAPAPAQLLPSAEQAPPPVLAERLRRASEELARVVTAATLAGRRTLEHPYFGGVRLVRYLDLQTLHVRHHLRQLRPAGS